jgi:CheY-like chemotaxis protein
MQAFERDRFDLVLMDIQMPEVNGVEASVAIRALEMKEGRARTPILALSANVMSHQIREYLDAGMCGFVSKPIKAADLVGAIQAAIEPAQDAELRMEDDDARPRVGSGRV